MADSLSIDKSLTRDSENLPDIYCEPCQDVEGKYIQAVALCKDCAESLCSDCVSAHRKQKYSRNHEIESKTSTTQKVTVQKSISEKCHRHQGEAIESYCMSCDQLCCKICHTVNHYVCKLENISTAAAGIKESKQLSALTEKLKILKKGYDDNLSKADKQSLNIEKNFSEAVRDMKKLQETFEKLLAETVKQAEHIKDKDLKQIESVSLACNTLVEQIDKVASSITTMQDNSTDEALFIMMKRTEGQLQSFEDRLNKLDTDNTIQQYTFEPDMKLNAMLEELKALGKLSCNSITRSGPMLQTPVFIKDIDSLSPQVRGLVILPNQQLILAENEQNTVKLINTEQNKIVSTIQLPDSPWDVTLVKLDEIAITRGSANKIQFMSVSSNKLTTGRDLAVNGECRGIEYNDKDATLIVTFVSPPKVEILSLDGTVIKSFESDISGNKLFQVPFCVTMSPEKTMLYVTDYYNHSVTMMNLNGDVKVVFADGNLQCPTGVCVNRSGIVYVASFRSNTIHQIAPGSDKMKPLINHGLTYPWALGYCDAEDKIYVGQWKTNNLKIFKMK